MTNDYKYTSEIENFVSMLIAKSKASNNYFIGGTVSNEIAKRWDDMLYVDINPQQDYNAHADGSASIFIYTRPQGPLNRKNLRLARDMERKIEHAVSQNNHPHYVTQVNWRDSGYNGQLDFFYNVINISITVK